MDDKIYSSKGEGGGKNHMIPTSFANRKLSRQNPASKEKILDLMFKLKFISIFLSAFANNLKGLYVRLDQFVLLKITI